MKISDALSIRCNVSEVTVWLWIIFSWITPYEWYVDLGIGVLVSVANAAMVVGARENQT